MLNYDLDTTSTEKTRTHISRYMNFELKELGITDIWRDMHSLDRDYTSTFNFFQDGLLLYDERRHTQGRIL